MLGPHEYFEIFELREKQLRNTCCHINALFKFSFLSRNIKKLKKKID